MTELRRNCSVVIALAAVQQYFSLEAELHDIEVLSTTVAIDGKRPLIDNHPARQHWAAGQTQTG